MGKFTSSLMLIFSVFDTAEWKAESISTYPSNYIAPATSSSEYVRIHILSGVLQIEIFTSVQAGPKRSAEIADSLDKYLSKKTLKVGGNSVQFATATCKPLGVDKSNTALFLSMFSINFNFYGV